jgi:hypothetical protein
MTEIYLEEAESGIAERGIYSDEGGIGKEFVVLTGLMAITDCLETIDARVTWRSNSWSVMRQKNVRRATPFAFDLHSLYRTSLATIFGQAL